jgi:glycosyltransferase involved in cell wall biosynthesis
VVSSEVDVMNKLGIVMVTYNRLAYTKRTLGDLLSTLQVEHRIVVVDNGSTDGTGEYLTQMMESHPELDVIFLGENRYPGAATNVGWRFLTDFEDGAFTHLMRCDNDMRFSYGWDTVSLSYFGEFYRLGQLGLDHRVLENAPPGVLDATKITGRHLTMYEWPGNVGGTCIIPRHVYDQGFRYSETPWHNERGMPTPQEDCMFSIALKNAGFIVAHASDGLVKTSAWDGGGQPPEDDDLFLDHLDYYKETLETRGYRGVHPWLWNE